MFEENTKNFLTGPDNKYGLWKRTKQLTIDLQIRKREWGWLGHTLRKPIDNITRQALEWNLQGKRSRGRPKNTWRRTVLEEAKGVKKTCAEIKCVAKNRVRWRNLVDALCSAAEWWDYSMIESGREVSKSRTCIHLSLLTCSPLLHVLSRIICLHTTKIGYIWRRGEVHEGFW